jgi:protein-export SecD/SecF family membrane protein
MEAFLSVLTIALAAAAAALALVVVFVLLFKYRGSLPKKGGAAVLLLLLALCLAGWGFVAVKGVGKDGALGAARIKQGLDLQGGVTIVYEADAASPAQDEMDTAIGIIRKRLDNMGATEADVAQEGGRRIRVDMPGVTDAEQAIADIGQTAKLTFVDPDGSVVADGQQVVRAQGAAQSGQTGAGVQYVVQLELNAEAAKSFGEATAKFTGSPIEIKLDDAVISAPIVQSVITDGNAVITGDFDPQSAADLAALIRAGALPFKLNVITFNTVGAKLGADSLEMSLWAGLIGGILVVAFMLIVYRAAGIAANMALLFYIALEIVIFSAFGITLTLPGIAGMVLSIGMAVDANVIVFERLKEELAIGRSLRYAIDIAFSKAFSAILDGNVTTLIAAAVLYWLGTGPIKGFAVTLGIGIIISMFSALVITRGLLKIVAGLGLSKPGAYGARLKEGGVKA